MIVPISFIHGTVLWQLLGKVLKCFAICNFALSISLLSTPYWWEGTAVCEKQQLWKVMLNICSSNKEMYFIVSSVRSVIIITNIQFCHYFISLQKDMRYARWKNTSYSDLYSSQKEKNFKVNGVFFLNSTFQPHHLVVNL